MAMINTTLNQISVSVIRKPCLTDQVALLYNTGLIVTEVNKL